MAPTTINTANRTADDLTGKELASLRMQAINAGESTKGWDRNELFRWAVAQQAAEPTRDSNGRITPPPVRNASAAPQAEPAPAAPSSLEAMIAAAVAPHVKGQLDEQRVIELVREHSAPTPHVIEVRNADTSEKVHVGLTHKAFERVLRAVKAGVHVMMVGPAGSGKTTICEQVATALDVPYFFSGAVQQEHKLLGFIDANGTYHRTAFRDAYEHGGVFNLDEIDGCSAKALLALNAALANGACDFPDAQVKRHENFVCVAGGNTFGRGADRQYVGRNQLDAASLDRFATVDIDYDEDLERALVPNTEWVERVQAIRAAVAKAGVRHIVSPRASINGGKLLAAGLDQDTVEDMVIYKGLSADQIEQIKAAL